MHVVVKKYLLRRHAWPESPPSRIEKYNVNILKILMAYMYAFEHREIYQEKFSTEIIIPKICYEIANSYFEDMRYLFRVLVDAFSPDGLVKWA